MSRPTCWPWHPRERAGARRRFELDFEAFGAATVTVDCGQITVDDCTGRTTVAIELDHPHLDRPAAVAMSLAEARVLRATLDEAIAYAANPLSA